MSSNLSITFLGRCAFLEIEAFQDGVLAEFRLDFEQRLLHFSFLGQILGLCLVLLAFGLIVSEEVELLRC